MEDNWVFSGGDVLPLPKAVRILSLSLSLPPTLSPSVTWYRLKSWGTPTCASPWWESRVWASLLVRDPPEQPEPFRRCHRESDIIGNSPMLESLKATLSFYPLWDFLAELSWWRARVEVPQGGRALHGEVGTGLVLSAVQSSNRNVVRPP